MPPPPADDDFAQQYANFDEASVASPETFSASAAGASPRRASPRAALTAGVPDEPESGTRRASAEEVRETVPAAIRELVERSFQSAFTRFVPASDARIFSAHGEISSDRAEPSAEDVQADSGDSPED